MVQHHPTVCAAFALQICGMYTHTHTRLQGSSGFLAPVYLRGNTGMKCYKMSSEAGSCVCGMQRRTEISSSFSRLQNLKCLVFSVVNGKTIHLFILLPIKHLLSQHQRGFYRAVKSKCLGFRLLDWAGQLWDYVIGNFCLYFQSHLLDWLVVLWVFVSL